MKELYELVITKLLVYWHKPIVALISIIILFLVLIVGFSSFSFSEISVGEWVIISVLITILFIVWYVTTRLPKTRKNHLGFAIAITSEDEIVRKEVINDLVSSLKSLLESIQAHTPFQIVVLPKWYSEKIGNINDARKYLSKTRSHIMLYGEAKIRKKGGKDHFVLRLREVVAHKPIREAQSKEFSDEMTEIFPGNINIEKGENLIGIEITSQWTALATKYFLASAAMISGDLKLSEFLLNELSKDRSFTGNLKIPGMSRLRSGIKQRLGQVYFLNAHVAHLRWRTSRDFEDLDIANEWNEKYGSISGKDYTYHIQKSIWWFVRKKNIHSAINELNQCKGNSDPIWRFSIAFIEAYRGNLDKAENEYKKAFSRGVVKQVYFEIEEFIEWFLNENPELIQLWYCLGLINYKGKGDDILAKFDFNKFLSNETSSKYPKQVISAKAYLNDIGK